MEAIIEKEKLHNLFYMNKGNCEIYEEDSPACKILKDKNLSSSDIESLYKKLKQYEKYFDEKHSIGEIRARELLVNHKNTPIEIIEDISKTRKLRDDYLFKYYGGYAGDDYRVVVDITETIAEKLESVGISYSQNLKKHLNDITEEKIAELEQQLFWNNYYEDSDQNDITDEIKLLKSSLYEINNDPLDDILDQIDQINLDVVLHHEENVVTTQDEEEDVLHEQR